MLVMVRTRGSTLQSPALLPPPSPGSSRPLIPTNAKAFPFQFIPIRKPHLDMMAVAYDRTVPDFSRVIGRTMVDENFLPLGMALAYFEPGPDGVVSINAHFGKWLRVYPKDILRGLHETIEELRDLGVKDVYAYADRNIKGSDTLLHWLGAEKTEKSTELGPIYKLELARSKI